MVVRLRLARHGRKNTPFYHLATINSSKRRDALPLEKLGEYDPIPRPAPTSSSLAHAIEKSFHLASRAPTADELRERREKRVVWDVERVRYWLGVGAQPTESVVKLLERVSSVSSFGCVAGADRGRKDRRSMPPKLRASGNKRSRDRRIPNRVLPEEDARRRCTCTGTGHGRAAYSANSKQNDGDEMDEGDVLGLDREWLSRKRACDGELHDALGEEDRPVHGVARWVRRSRRQ
ncbi:hypothetical protein QFC20_005930 [Naganishia adeliensis]|uniref:Uncharacterized protein n=1 Tax=Naganishia adeliensis TaxID=92952 RepID=A0ACC2VHW2_9TREE|nr:hypothetical protein QFC20_005930 [Naganishia adeliensis]